MTNPQIDLVCAHCGSNNVLIDAFVQWSVEKQDFEIVTTFDKGHVCEDCGGECSVNEIALSDSST